MAKTAKLKVQNHHTKAILSIGFVTILTNKDNAKLSHPTTVKPLGLMARLGNLLVSTLWCFPMENAKQAHGENLDKRNNSIHRPTP